MASTQLTTIPRAALPALTALALLPACGSSERAIGPTSVPYGQTTFVVFVNPAVNALNTVSVTEPDTLRRDSVAVSLPFGPLDVTGKAGLATLSPVDAGTRVIALSRDSLRGQASVSIASRDLREVAIALTPSGTAVMTSVLYAFGGRVVTVKPTTPIGDVNRALAESNVIVFFRSGIYGGDLTFSGSNVTLYGEGRNGGTVKIAGNVTVNGSGNRIRGAHITGSLGVPANGFGMSLTRVDGPFQLNGSGATLLQNSFCGTVSSGTSNVTALGNAGMAPLAASVDC